MSWVTKASSPGSGAAAVGFAGELLGITATSRAREEQLWQELRRDYQRDLGL